MTNAAVASIDFLSSIPSEVLQDSGPFGRVYDLQLSAERTQRELDWQRERLRDEIDREDRMAAAHNRIGSLTSAHERIEADSRVVELKQELSALRGQVTEAQAQVGGIVFLPACDNLDKIQKNLAALSRKGSKIGTGEITLTVSEETLVLNYGYAEDGHKMLHADFKHVFAVLTGTTPQIPGFEFLARVIPTEQGNVVNKLPAIRHFLHNGFRTDPGFQSEEQAQAALDAIDLTKYLHTGDVCEHCHKDRARKDCYVVYNAQTGETLQVGRTCLRDFMGSNDPERVLAALEQYMEIMRNIGQRSERPVIRTMTFLTHCAAIMRTEGNYVSGLGSGGVGNLWNMINQKTHQGRKLWIDPIPADEQMAAAMLRWVREEWDEDGEFPTKVKIALAGESVDERLYNIAGAVYAARPRWLANADKRAARKSAKEEAAKRTFIGTVGERQVFELTVTNITWVDGYAYNTQKPVINLADADGNRVTWFASDLPRIADNDEYGPVIGGTYQVRATVKDHETHETYGKSTIISRPKFEKTISEPR